MQFSVYIQNPSLSLLSVSVPVSVSASLSPTLSLSLFPFAYFPRRINVAQLFTRGLKKRRNPKTSVCRSPIFFFFFVLYRNSLTYLPEITNKYVLYLHSAWFVRSNLRHPSQTIKANIGEKQPAALFELWASAWSRKTQAAAPDRRLNRRQTRAHRRPQR